MISWFGAGEPPDDYAARAETIHSDLLDQLPDDLEISARTTSRSWIDESERLVPRERQILSVLLDGRSA